MKRRKTSVNINRIIILFFFFTVYKGTYSQIVISNQGAPAATIISGFIGVGLAISNPVITCPSVAYGTFSGGSGIGVTNGVVLTNGTASQLANPESFFMSTSNGTTCSDPQLIALDPLATNDCCILEFDVIPSCNSLTIRFVFGSEEYPNFVASSFNDAFGFFVTGPNPAGGNYTNKNIALVTGSTICSINNVNSTTNAGFYVDNTGGTQLPFGGYTSAITSSLSVTPCQSYHWKMAIADALDHSYDSGVLVDFLQCATVLSASATATAPTCGATNGTATATATAGMGALTYTWSPAPGGGQGTANATGLTGGVTYTVTVNDTYACTTAATATVTVPASAGGPVVTNSPLTQTICSGSSTSLVNLTANMVGSTFTWTATATPGVSGFSASGTSTIPVQTITNSGSTNGTVTYSITPTAAGCPGAVTNYIVTILPAKTPTFAAIANPCQNATAPVIPTSSTNVPPITGTWSPAVSTAVLGTTVYTFTPTAGQCATNTTLNITVSTPVTPTFAAIANPCQNATAPVIPTSSTNIPPITGTWSPAVSTAVLGTAVYTFTPTAGQCAANTTLNITVSTPITPTFAAIANPCQNATAPVIPVSSTNIPPVTGTWSPAVSTAALGTIVYTFTPTAGQCATNTTLNITVSTPVTPTFAAVGNPCQNATAPVIPTSSTNIPPITGTWSPAVSTATLGTSSYLFTPTVGQCASTTTLTITVSTPVTPTFSAIANVCQNSVAPVLPLTSINAISGSWAPSVSTLTAGTTIYTFMPTTGQCAITTTTQITVDPEIIPTFAPIGSVCQNATAPVIPTNSTNIPPITGSWSPAVSTATLGTTIYTFTPSVGQCVTNATLSIAVTTPITPIFSAIPDLCQNAPAPVLSTSSLNSPPIVGTWSPTVDVSIPATTAYTFTPAIGQCAASATLNIVVNPYPTLVVFPPAAVCFPAKVDLTLQEVTAGSTGSIYYSASSTGLPHLGNPSAISVSGTYYIISENNFGCEVILPVNVVVEPSPQAEFIPTPSTLNLYNLSSTMVNNSVGGESYQWFFMDGGTSAESNPTHIFPDSIFGEQLITLIVTSINGCADTTQKVVIINDELIFYVPNTFTPDGDTYNQTFQPIFTSGYDPLVFSMLIYNRWGEVVFETNDASMGWDGTFGENGNMVQEGVYTWKIEFKTNKKDKHQLVTGSVNILR